MELPEGYEKMELELIMTPKELEIFKKHILRMLLRDFYIFYSVKQYDGYCKLYFYCNPMYEMSLTYRIGCYNQTMLNYYNEKEITKSDHVVSEDYI